jgi:hypothetical protein
MKSFLNVHGGSILSKLLWSIIFSLVAVILYLQKGINNILLFISRASVHIDSVHQSNKNSSLQTFLHKRNCAYPCHCSCPIPASLLLHNILTLSVWFSLLYYVYKISSTAQICFLYLLGNQKIRIGKNNKFKGNSLANLDFFTDYR